MHSVFNRSFSKPTTFEFGYPQLTKADKNLMIAGFFEQLMLFDKITICTGRLNVSLCVLIDELGINIVEQLMEQGFIKFMIWSPVIVSGTGRGNDVDSSVDVSVIYGQPPIVAGSLGPDDRDPENNIDKALNSFPIDRERKRIFKRIALKQYVNIDGMSFSGNTTNLILEAYKSDVLTEFGLPYTVEPDQLHLNQREQLLQLGHKLIEAAVLTEYGLKSFENFEQFKILQKSIENIGKAYNISSNTSELFRIENMLDLKKLFLEQKLSFESVFKLRYNPNAKYFRKWINNVGENSDVSEVTAEYANEIKGNNKFFESTGGNLFKSMVMFGVTSFLPLSLPVQAGLTLLEILIIDKILKGKNPSMFIDDVKDEINKSV